MYGLWLFKELKTEYGNCKVELYRKGYTASAVEIGGFVGNSLNLALENLDTITAPIGKSVCSFSIYDTEQVEYDDLFTPDATAYKVVISTKVDGGEYNPRWSGYVTPDFFAENLSYRTPISISARDNIGYLNDVDFDLDTATITVRELIQAAFNRIAEDYPMQIVFATQKQTAEGILAIDATISTYLLREMSWYEALETILHDLGLQMRWVDNNTIAVLDISQLGEKFAVQSFNFISSSGYREILPAWRELAQEQSYGVLDNFYKGQIDGENKLEYAANSAISSNILLYQPKSITQWSRQGEVYFLNFYNSYNAEIDDDKQDSIFITGIAPTVTNAEVLEKKMVYSQAVTEVDKQIKMTFNLNDTLRTPLSSQYSRGERNTLYLPYSQSSGTTMLKTPRPYQLKYRFNIFLRANDGTNYVMREDWVEESALAEQPFIEFLTDKLQTVDTGVTDGQGNHRFAYSGYNNSKEYSITIGSIPKAGTLEFVVYPWTFEKDDYSGARDAATYQRGAKISDIVFSVQVGKTGVETKTQVGVLHNIAEKANYSFGQVPQREGDIITYAGGLFKSDTITALQGFKRNVDSTTYPLLELVGREIIHFNKKNYNKLSGTIKNLAKEPLRFDRMLNYKGKNYLPFAYSLDVISNTMNITTMQEVEPYITHSFVEIKSELVTGGGATVSGGNNTALQYSAEVGNAKRISELNNASENEKKESYIIIDNANWNESKKVPLSEMEGLNEEQVEAYLTEKKYATQSWVKGITDDLETDISNRVLVTDFEKLEDAVEGIAGYFTNGSANNALKLGGQLPSYYATKSALDTTNGNVVSLTQRMGTAESGISTNKTNIATITTGLSNLTSRVSTAEGTIKEHTDAIALNANNIASNAKSITTNATAITAVSNRVKTFEDVIGIDSNGDVYIKGTRNFYTEGGTIGMAGLGSGGGGGTAGLGSVTVRVNGQDYITDASGIVTLPNYPSLAGYATEQWVADRGYITNAALNGYAKLTDIPTSLPASDVYSWAKAATKPTYTASEVGALSISGGTVTGDFGVKNTHGGILIQNSQNGNNGFIVYEGGTSWAVTDNNWCNTYQIYHTGNFNPSDYLPLGGGTISGTIAKPLTVNTSSSYVGIDLKVGGVNKSMVAWEGGFGTYIYEYDSASFLGIVNGNPYCYFGGMSHTLIHSGNIGSYNAGSATKLQTASGTLYASTNGTTYSAFGIRGLVNYFDGIECRINYGSSNTVGFILNSSGNVTIGSSDLASTTTKLYVDGGIRFAPRTIWGQSFDGSANVSGALYDASNQEFIYSSGNLVRLGTGTAAKGCNTYIDGNNIYLRYGTTYNDGIALTSSGNVLMGTTSDTGDKLRVYGSLRADGVITGTSAIKMSWSGASTCGLYPNDWISSDGVNSRLWLYNDNQLALYGSEIQLRNNTSISGNLIVTGDITSEGTMAMARLASSSDRSLKNNIAEVSAEQSMSIIRQLRPTTWNWKKDGKKSYGFIAQEVEPIVPEMVVNMEHLHLEYNQLHAFEIGAIKHIDSEVETLKRDLKNANNRIESLENELKQYRRNAQWQ